MNLKNSIGVLKGIGEKTELNLNRLGIYTLEDLIEYYPRNYDIYSEPVMLADVCPGSIFAVYSAVSHKVNVIKKGRFQMVNTVLEDTTGKITLVWYNMPYLKNSLKMGERFVFRGRISVKNGKRIMEHPQIYRIEEYEKKLNSMQPVYPLTDGVTNNQLYKFISAALDELDLTQEYLPVEIREKYQLAEYNYAVRMVHFPTDMECLKIARRRLVFEDFFVFSLALRRIRDQKEVVHNNFEFNHNERTARLIKNLPYTLTEAQKRVWEEVRHDLDSPYVMNRLIQGDVGSGKTVIAALALLHVAENGWQGCMMAPTEVLAEQHYANLKHLLGNEKYGIKIELLTGAMTAKEKRLAYERIENHDVDIIVGTHAVIQDKVNYDNLALVITDEQHRFGVRQREVLNQKGRDPHVLVMSATPIPRTLAIILYGDLDISVIDELPAMRLPIKNCVVGTQYRPTAYKFIENQVKEGHQAYVICPMVEDNELVDAENVIDYTDKLKEALPKDIHVEYLHGKMTPKEKNDIMLRFKKNETHVLVSTTVVEVGVDVPNATVMMVENAQRFGLAQLHQLRGRVGRGDAQSYCIFICTSDSKVASERLEILIKSNDGFHIASEDLKLRGPGDLFGLKQSGIMEFRIGDVFNDMDVLQEANSAVNRLMQMDPLLEKPENRFLGEKLERYLKGEGNGLVI